MLTQNLWTIPKRFEGASLETAHPNQGKAFEKIVANGGGYLHGEKGCGKSWLAALWLKEMRKKIDHIGKWIQQGDLVIAANSDDLPKIMENWSWYGALVIDDFEPNALTPHRGEILFSLLNARYAGKKFTLVTSQLSPSDISRVSPHWDAFIDRLSESGVYRLSGQSLRSPKC